MRKLSSLLSADALAATIGASGAAKASDHEVIIGFAIAESGWMNGIVTLTAV